MDTFRFLKYWKTHGAFAVNSGSNVRTANTITSTLAAASHHPSSTDADGIESYGKSNLDCANYMGNEDDDDEFFKFTEPIDLFLNGSEPNEKSRASAIKSAAVFRVLTSRLKKSKTNGAEKTESNGSVSTTANQKQRILNPNRRSNVSNSDKQRISAESGPNDTRFSTDLVQKYLKGVKPMYIRVSKRYNDKKLRLKSPRNLRYGQSQPLCKSNSTSSMSVKSPPVIFFLNNSNPKIEILLGLLVSESSILSENWSEELREAGNGGDVSERLKSDIIEIVYSMFSGFDLEA